MCRHFLPRFDLPVSQIVHTVGRLVATHPVSTLAALLVPAVVTLGIVIHHRLRRPVVGRLDASRAEPRRGPPDAALRDLRAVHQG